MTRPLLILAAIVLAFANFELWLFSLIDRSMDQATQRMVMRDTKGAIIYQCYSLPKRSKR